MSQSEKNKLTVKWKCFITCKYRNFPKIFHWHQHFFFRVTYIHINFLPASMHQNDRHFNAFINSIRTNFIIKFSWICWIKVNRNILPINCIGWNTLDWTILILVNPGERPLNMYTQHKYINFSLFFSFSFVSLLQCNHFSHRHKAIMSTMLQI